MDSREEKPEKAKHNVVPLTRLREQECQKHARHSPVSSHLPAECSAVALSFFPRALDAVVAAAPRAPATTAEICCRDSRTRKWFSFF